MFCPVCLPVLSAYMSCGFCGQPRACSTSSSKPCFSRLGVACKIPCRPVIIHRWRIPAQRPQTRLLLITENNNPSIIVLLVALEKTACFPISRCLCYKQRKWKAPRKAVCGEPHLASRRYLSLSWAYICLSDLSKEHRWGLSLHAKAFTSMAASFSRCSFFCRGMVLRLVRWIHALCVRLTS